MPTMTCNQMLPAVGATVQVRCNGLIVACEVRDVKNSYGKPRLHVSPLAGSGAVWVELSRIVVPSRALAVA